MKYFECHITMLGDPSFIRPKVEALKWKFSVIDGDPVLGSGVKCYATRLSKESLGADRVLEQLLHTAATLAWEGCEILRRKVEMVIYDDKTSRVRCTGGCPECHLDDIEEDSLLQKIETLPRYGYTTCVDDGISQSPTGPYISRLHVLNLLK